MDPAPRPYLLPKLSDVWRGAGQGIGTGGNTGLWSGPLTVMPPVLLSWVHSPGGRPVSLDLLAELVMIGLCCAAAGLLTGACIGFFSGGATYLVLFPFLPPDRWPEMDAALATSMKRGTVIAQIVAGLSLILVFSPLPKYLALWFPGAMPVLALAWCALTPGGFMLGGFFGVARLMSSRDSIDIA